MPEPDYNTSAVSSAPTSSPSPQSRPSGLGSRSGRNMDADMYAGSSYAPTSGAGTAGATQTFSSSATSTGSFTGAASNKSDDGPGYGQSYNPAATLYSNTATALTAAGVNLTPPTQASYDPMNLYSTQSMAEIATEINDYLRGTAIDDAMREALGIPELEVYQGPKTEEEPDPIVDTDKLKDALQPEPITVEELPDVIVKAGDTLSAIAEANNVPVQDVIDANPQIANPDMIRPGQKVNMPDPRKLGGSEGYGNPVGDLSIFSKPVDNSYTEFMDIEGDKSHLGGADYKEVGITLPMGIVPTSGLKYTHNGTTIDLPADRSKRWDALSKAGVTLKNFDPSNVDMSQVVKDGVKRSDYDTDENFTKAVLASFEDSVIKEIENEGVDADKIDDAALEGLISLAWNVQGHKWKDIEPAYKEMVKENPDMTKVQSGMLQVFTSGGIVVRGLAERRAKDYNKVAEGMGQPTIESYTPVKLKNGNAGFEYAMSDGTTVTRDTGKDYATKASQGSFKKHLNKKTNL